MNRHINTLELHQLRYGELSGDTLRDVRAHLDTCELCAGRLRAQENARAAFELQPVPEALRTPERAPSRRTWWALLLAPVMVAAAALVAVQVATGPGDAVEDGVRTKGLQVDAVANDHLQVWLRTQDGTRAARPDDRLAAGDRVQVRYHDDDYALVTFAGRDGTGEAEVYSTVEVAGSDWYDGVALTLDGTPGEQVLYAVYSDDVLDPAALEAALESDRPLRGAEIYGLVLQKAD